MMCDSGCVSRRDLRTSRPFTSRGKKRCRETPTRGRNSPPQLGSAGLEQGLLR